MKLTSYELVGLVLSILAVIVFPLLALSLRSAVKWARLEAKVDVALRDIKALVSNKDSVHLQIAEQMSKDREATDRRLRWLEEYLWRKGSDSAV